MSDLLEPRIVIGDVLEQLAALSDDSIHCVVTSPPYWNLRDYGTGSWDGGDPECDHVRPSTNMNEGFNERWGQGAGVRKQERKSDGQYPDVCAKCGATRVDRQLGLEPTPDEFVARMVAVFREVRRVLRPEGTCWLNIGDSYNSTRNGGIGGNSGLSNPDRQEMLSSAVAQHKPVSRTTYGTIKPKDLVMIPHRLALALQADGWWVRSDIIWRKPNPMPESIRDRPTSAHEHMLLLAKSSRYFYDAEAVREPYTQPTERSGRFPEGWADGDSQHDAIVHSRRARGPDGRKQTTIASNGAGVSTHENYEGRQGGERWPNPDGRNLRNVWDITVQEYAAEMGEVLALLLDGRGERPDVWEIPTESYAEAHFATFPTKLVQPCILAGTSEKGCCPLCGAPIARVTEEEFVPQADVADSPALMRSADGLDESSGMAGTPRGTVSVTTVGWEPTCACAGDVVNLMQPVPCTVLDPFAGSGTTLLVARRLNRASLGIELNPEYAALAGKRLERWWERPKQARVEPIDGQLDLLATP